MHNAILETKDLISGLELPDTSKITDAAVGPKNISKQSRKIIRL